MINMLAPSSMNMTPNFMAAPNAFGQQQSIFGQQQSMMGLMMMQLTSAMAMLTQMLMMRQMQMPLSANGNFGNSGGASNGISSFLGDSSGGTSAAGGASSSNGLSSDLGSVPAWGAQMAKDAEKHATTGAGGWCFRGVCQALERAGVKGGVGGASAYMAGDQLAKNPKFREVQVDAKDLPKLPAGAIVVWDRGGTNAGPAGKEHGHISIALGDGREVSDIIRKQTTNMGSKHRVFLPK